MTNVEQFKNKYSEFETLVRLKLHRSPDEMLKDKSGNYISAAQLLCEEDPRFVSKAEELEFCAKLRNYLSHSSLINETAAISPSDKTIQVLQKVIDRLNDVDLIGKHMVKKETILWKVLSDNVRKTMEEMKSNKYTAIPILNDDGSVLGVFSENTILNILMRSENPQIGGETVFRDIQEFLKLSGQKGERYYFAKQDALFVEVAQLFRQDPDDDKHIGLVFITENGKTDEALIGIVSAWEIANGVV